jgi:hypothetical protein
MITSDDLIESVTRGASIPIYQPRFSREAILALADEEIGSRIVPLIKSLRQDYFLFQQSQTTVANQSNYQIPHRAIGGTVLDLTYDSHSLKHINPSQATLAASGDPHSFFFLQDSVVLYPTPSSAKTLLFTYELAPGKLVETSACAQASAKSSTSITSSSIPSSFLANIEVDFIKGNGQCASLSLESQVSNVSSTTVDFAADIIPSSFEVGDWVCLAGESCVLQIPKETRPLLALAVQARIFEAIGDENMIQLTDRKLKEKLEQVKSVLTPRIKFESQIIMGGLHPNRNRRIRFPNP